jgi:hypothetical protein
MKILIYNASHGCSDWRCLIGEKKMQAKMAQIIAIIYINEKNQNIVDLLMLSGEQGLDMDTLACHKGWFVDSDDFYDWLENHHAYKQYYSDRKAIFNQMQDFLGLCFK